MASRCETVYWSNLRRYITMYCLQFVPPNYAEIPIHFNKSLVIGTWTWIIEQTLAVPKINIASSLIRHAWPTFSCSYYNTVQLFKTGVCHAFLSTHSPAKSYNIVVKYRHSNAAVSLEVAFRRTQEMSCGVRACLMTTLAKRWFNWWMFEWSLARRPHGQRGQWRWVIGVLALCNSDASVSWHVTSSDTKCPNIHKKMTNLKCATYSGAILNGLAQVLHLALWISLYFKKDSPTSPDTDTLAPKRRPLNVVPSSRIKLPVVVIFNLNNI